MTERESDKTRFSFCVVVLSAWEGLEGNKNATSLKLAARQDQHAEAARQSSEAREHRKFSSLEGDENFLRVLPPSDIDA